MKRTFIFLCAAIFGITAGIICGTVFAVTAVTDRTMEPNYLEGDHVLLQCRFEEYDRLQRGDVVIFENHLYQKTGESGLMMKRIIGLPGEEIWMYNGRVYVNGDLLNDSWTDTYGRGADMMEPQIVPKGCYFVLGDNRRQSTDSRDETVGMINEDEIIGKVIRQW